MPKRLLFVVSTFFLALSPVAGRSLVSLLPSNTEILDALGAGSEIVGITRFDRPVPGRQIVGDFFQPNVEVIMALHPDIVVAGVSASNRSTVRLRELGLRVIEVPNPRSLNELYQSIRDLGALVERAGQADAVVRNMTQRLEAVRARQAKRKRTWRTYIEIDPPFWTLGGKDVLSEALSTVGIENIFSDLTRPSAQVSPEVIVERNPELILSFETPAVEIRQRPGWGAIQAVKKGAIIDDQNRDRLARPSPPLVEAIETLEKRLEAYR